MLMNAQPRAVSSGFRTFVPKHRPELSYQRLAKMANNEVNVWGVLRPAASSVPTPEKWDDAFGEIHEEENFLIHFTPDFHNESFETIPASVQARVTGNPKTYTQGGVVPREQGMTMRRTANQSPYELQNIPSSCFNRSTPMFRGHTHEWMTDDIAAANSRYSKSQLSSSTFSFCDAQIQEDGNLIPMPSLSTDISSWSLRSTPFAGSFDSNKASPVYSNSFATTEPSDPMAMSFTSLAVQDNLYDAKWWNEMEESPNSPDMGTAVSSYTYDGLPNQCSNTWLMGSGSSLFWLQQTVPQGTISPEALSLRSVSSSALSPASSCSGWLPASGSGEPPLTSVPSEILHTANISYSNARLSRPRQRLPSEPTKQAHVQTLPKNDRRISAADKKRPLRARSAVQSGFKDIPQVSASDDCHYLRKVESKERSLVPKKIEPKPNSRQMLDNVEVSSKCMMGSSDKAKPSPCRDARDEFLVRSKLAGMSYKDIRKKGGFTEAESTLRGRFRTLTKKKEERVRKPEWEDNDIRLLKKAVRKLAKDFDSSKSKVPWKQVADYIFEHGGSYRFGNATCRKRWDELHT